MKIYNRKNFYSGAFFLLLGIALVSVQIWKQSFEAKSIVLAAAMLFIGIGTLLRATSKSCAARDKIEEKDERNLLISYRTKSMSFSLLRAISLVLCWIFAIAAIAHPAKEAQLVFASGMIVTGLLFTISFVVELICSIYYEAHT